MRYWITMIAVGVMIGALSIIMPGGLLQEEKVADLQGLQQLSRKELIKQIDKKRIEGVRMASAKRYPEAVAVFLHLIDINQYDQFNYAQLARIAKAVGTNTFEELLATEEENRSIYDVDRIKGAVYYQIGEWEQAESHLNSFLIRSPNDLAATFYKGATLRKTGRLNEAEELLTSVIEREKTYFYAYLELQELYETTKNAGKANTMLELAIEYNPANNENAICHGVPEP